MTKSRELYACARGVSLTRVRKGGGNLGCATKVDSLCVSVQVAAAKLGMENEGADLVQRVGTLERFGRCES